MKTVHFHFNTSVTARKAAFRSAVAEGALTAIAVFPVVIRPLRQMTEQRGVRVGRRHVLGEVAPEKLFEELVAPALTDLGPSPMADLSCGERHEGRLKTFFRPGRRCARTQG